MIQRFLQHKFLSLLVIAVVVIGGYVGYKKFLAPKEGVRYVTERVQKGTLIVAVSGSGKVSTIDTVDVKSKVSGDVLSVYVKGGQLVRSGAMLVQLDARDAQKAVRDAEVNLESAKLSLTKLQEPADALSLLQSEHALAQAKESKTKAEDDLAKAYEDGFNAVANAFLDLPNIMSGLQDVLFGKNVSTSQWNIDAYVDAVQDYDATIKTYRNDSYDKYQIARTAYDSNFVAYKLASRFSSTDVIERLIAETYDTSRSVAESVKSANNLIRFYQDKLTEKNVKPNALATTHLTSLDGYTSKANTHLVSLLAAKRTLQNNKDAIVNADRSIAERTESLRKLKEGADALDIRSLQLSIQQRTNALLDARERLADYFIRAPFDGVVTTMDLKRGDTVSASTVVTTLITEQKIAEIPLNEIDAAKVHASQKATLTFDAVPDVSISGEVKEIDTLGTVSQGVVTYTAKILFDTQDDRVKPGMSASASIVIEAKPDVLIIPQSAVKQDGESQYVEVMGRGAAIPRRQIVTTGITNDIAIEIVNGLTEGDRVVVRTIEPSAASTTTQQSSPFFRVPGQSGGGARSGGVNIQRR